MTNGRLPPLKIILWSLATPPFVNSAGSPLSRGMFIAQYMLFKPPSECEWREGEGESQAIRVSGKVGQRRICVDLKIASPVIWRCLTKKDMFLQTATLFSILRLLSRSV